MFEKNEQFQRFKTELESRGISLRLIWSAKTDNIAKYDNVVMYQVIGGGKNAPKTIIARDYGDNGFGIWYEPRDARFSEDVKILTGEKKTF